MTGLIDKKPGSGEEQVDWLGVNRVAVSLLVVVLLLSLRTGGETVASSSGTVRATGFLLTQFTKDVMRIRST